MSPVEVPLTTTKRKNPAQAEEIGTKLEKKLHHDTRQVRKAAKKAKTFETQKILKRIRDARHKGDDNTVKDIEEQHMALKHLNSDLIADSALTTRIKKDKFLSQDPILRSAMSQSLSASFISPAAHSSAASKVQSRLLSSKILAADVSRIIEGLRRLLSPAERAYDARNEDADVSQPLKKKHKTQEKEDLRKVPLVDEPSASIEDDGWESGTVSDDGHSVRGELQITSMGKGSDEEDKSGSEGDNGDPIIPRGQPGRDVKRESKASAAQSTFLPSLSVGFIRGDSDTDFSDSEAKAADEGKKNRRGQRARRAIWEKKFGRNANHVMKQNDISRASNHSHSPSGTAVHKDRRQHRGGKRDIDGAPFSDSKTRISDKNDISARRMSGLRKEDKLLHPSWEAKRKQRNVAIMPPQGTRIVFD